MFEHPMFPSLELLKRWEDLHFDEGENYDVMLIQAYQAGADAELEECCVWLRGNDPYEHDYHQMLRAARRPKPPSLKERALRILVENGTTLDGRIELEPDDIGTIRRALEQLDD